MCGAARGPRSCRSPEEKRTTRRENKTKLTPPPPSAYPHAHHSLNASYFYISIAYNVCYTLALLGLVLFWSGAAELLAPFNPLLKFLVVKTVVFLTFWQGLVISAVHSARGGLGGPEQGKEVQNFLILGEMVLAAVGMLYGFPHAEYSYGGAARGFRAAAFAHAASVRDVVADVTHAVREREGERYMGLLLLLLSMSV